MLTITEEVVSNRIGLQAWFCPSPNPMSGTLPSLRTGSESRFEDSEMDFHSVTSKEELELEPRL